MSEVTVVLDVNEVVIAKQVTDLDVVQVVQEVALTAPGPQGPRGLQGPAGVPGGAFLVHEQPSPAGSWIVNHNFGRPVFVTVLNSAGRQVLADIDQSDPNTASIIFATPTSGKAVVS